MLIAICHSLRISRFQRFRNVPISFLGRCPSLSYFTLLALAFPLIQKAFSLTLATALTFQIFRRVASSYISIPGWMVGPGPRACDGAISHRAKRPRHGGCSFVDVNYESRQHQ